MWVFFEISTLMSWMKFELLLQLFLDYETSTFVLQDFSCFTCLQRTPYIRVEELGGLSSDVIPHDMSFFMSPRQSSHGRRFGATVLREGEEILALDFCMITIIQSLQCVWLSFNSWTQSLILPNLENQCLQSGRTLEMEHNLVWILATCAWQQVCQHRLLLHLKPKSSVNLLEHLIWYWTRKHHHHQLPNQYQAAGGVSSSYLSGRAYIFLLLL